MEILITEDFIEHRSEKAALYNQRGRTDTKFLMDIDCELLEYHLIKHGVWDEHDDWKVDAVTPRGNIDVKFIDKWYNISPQKMLNILHQRNILDGYVFAEWKDTFTRPVEVGDTRTIGIIGYISYERVAERIRVSGYNGHYLDARKTVLASDRELPELQDFVSQSNI